MKLCLLTLGFLFVLHSTNAQEKAVTSNGDEVILYKDGTWKYVNDSAMKAATQIDTNKTNFTKIAAASFLVKSNKTDCGVYIDPKKWNFSKKSGNEDAEYEFNAKDKDVYGMLIAERIEIPIETLKTIAFDNAKQAAPDIKIVKEEYRWVNGKLVLFMQMNGTIQGIKFTYLGHYYSSAKGTVQFITYTSTNLVTEYKKELEEFLNGFSVL